MGQAESVFDEFGSLGYGDCVDQPVSDRLSQDNTMETEELMEGRRYVSVFFVSVSHSVSLILFHSLYLNCWTK